MPVTLLHACCKFDGYNDIKFDGYLTENSNSFTTQTTDQISINTTKNTTTTPYLPSLPEQGKSIPR